MRRHWGNGYGMVEQTHGGVIPENVRIEQNGDVTIAVNGDYYAGSKRGIDMNSPYDSYVSDGTSTGGVVISKQTYGPGKFEAVMKIPTVNGVCASLWLFNYWEDGAGVHNHEIDIELHGTVNTEYSEHGVGTYRKALFTSWLTETNKISEYKALDYALNDGQFHKYTIEWHTGDDARILYYIDGVLICTQTTHVPDNEMYVNIGCWFPYNWCGDPKFETDTMVIRSFAYTPFAGETAGKVNTASNTVSDRYYAVPTAGDGFTSNLIANGDFEIRTGNFQNGNTDKYVWAFTDAPTKSNGSVTFTGTMSQTVELDCGSLPLTFELSGSGSASVVIEYGSIVHGVTVTGSATFDYVGGTQAFDFTPPENCTSFTVKIVSTDGVTLTSVKLANKTDAAM